MNYKKAIKRSLMVVLILLAIIMIIFLGSQLFWGIAMGKKDIYISTTEEDIFLENVEENNKLAISNHGMSKKSRFKYIYIYERGYEKPSITLDKNNIKKFSDSIFTEFMKVYSLKKETDSLFITFKLDSLQDKKTKNYYHIDTTFHYKVK